MRIITRIIQSAMICLALALTACSASPTFGPLDTPTPEPMPIDTNTPTPTPVEVQGTISIWHSWPDARLPALLRRLSAFQAAYPGIQFDVTYVPSVDLRNSFEQALQEGDGPTLLIGPADWGPELYDKGMIADLSATADPNVLNTLNLAAVGEGRYKDKQIGLPLDISGVVLYRNKNIIPQAPATFDELITLAKAANQGEIVGAFLDRALFYSGGHLAGLGGKLMQPDGSPAFNDEKGLSWIQLLKDFEQAGPTDYGTENDVQLFKEGRVGFLIDTTEKRDDLAQAIGPENLAIDPWPLYGSGSLSGFVQAENIYLTPRAMGEDQLISLKFAQYLLTSESQPALSEVKLIPSINPSQLNAAGSQALPADPLIAEAMQALSGGTSYPIGPEMPVFSGQLDIALQSIFSGEATPADALNKAAESIRLSLAESNATETPAP
jgi:maltose-binding protein MalE